MAIQRSEQKLSIRRSEFPAGEDFDRMFREFEGIFFNLRKSINTIADRIEEISNRSQSQDKNDPKLGSFNMWMSNGTNTGDDGDIIVKITDNSGITKTTTLLDFSSL